MVLKDLIFKDQELSTPVFRPAFFGAVIGNGLPGAIAFRINAVPVDPKLFKQTFN
jgi:hypothetical protein